VISNKYPSVSEMFDQKLRSAPMSANRITAVQLIESLYRSPSLIETPIPALDGYILGMKRRMSDMDRSMLEMK
jgi:hypothetical protein